MNKYTERLIKEWKAYGKIIIAVDFDDTIYPWGYKDNEDLLRLKEIVRILQIARETGAFITIFSCSAPDRHEEIQAYCESIQLPIDSINTNPISLPYGNHGKVYANVFLDDRAGLDEALKMLEDAMYVIRGKKAANLTLGEQV